MGGVLAEQERKYGDERSIVTDGASADITDVCDWTLALTYSIIVTAGFTAELVGIKGTFGGTGAFNASGKILVDDKPVWTTGGTTELSTVSPDLYVLLATGSHTVKFYTAIWHKTGNIAVNWSTVNVGVLNFNDMLSGGPWDSGVVAATQNVLTTAIDEDIVLPTTGRILPIGNIANYAVLIYIYAEDMSGSPTRRTHVKPYTTSYDAGHLNVICTVTGLSTYGPSFITTVNNDDDDGDATNPSYGIGSSGIVIAGVAVGNTVNVLIKLFTDQASVSGQVHAVAFLCPWFIPQSDISPATLNFSQQSTFYAIIEPLLQDVEKSSKIGKERFYSFGDDTDFYSVESGVGILIHSYTFEIVDVPSAEWIVTSTEIACVSYIGVDAR